MHISLPVTARHAHCALQRDDAAMATSWACLCLLTVFVKGDEMVSEKGGAQTRSHAGDHFGAVGILLGNFSKEKCEREMRSAKSRSFRKLQKKVREDKALI